MSDQPTKNNNITEEVQVALDYGDMRLAAEALGLKTLNPDWTVGDGTAVTHKTVTFDCGSGKKGYLRYNKDTNKLQFSNDGVVFTDMGSAPALVDLPALQPDGTEPGVPASDTMAVFVKADGVTPSRVIKYCVKDQTGRVTVLSSIIV